MFGFLSRFVDSNDRELKRIEPVVDAANEIEPELLAMSDADIRPRVESRRAPEGPQEGGPRPRPGGDGRRRRGGLRDGPRGDATDARDAPLRRPAHRRGGAPRGQERRGEDRGGGG